MVRDAIIHYYPYVLVVFTLMYLLLKSYLIVSRKLTDEYGFLMMNSFKIHSKQMLRNTFNEPHKRFFKKSNNINKVFYVSVLAVTVVYMVMYATL